MKNNWQGVWQNKVYDSENIKLSKLIEIDGFDSGFTGYTEQGLR